MMPLSSMVVLTKVATLMKALMKKDKEKHREALQNKGQKMAGYDDEKKTIKFLRDQMRLDATLSKSVQVSSNEYDETEAISFLLEKMKTTRLEDFTVDETIKAAISAFQHLFQKEFKANEIEVTVMDPKYFVAFQEAKYKDIYVKELESETKYHLDAINETGSAWCCKDGGFLKRRLLERRLDHHIWKGIVEEQRAGQTEAL